MCWAPLAQRLARLLTISLHLTAVEAIPAVYPSPGDPARRGLPSRAGALDGAFLPPLSPTRADGPGAESIWGKADPGRPVFADSWELRAQLEAVAKAAAGAQALAAEAVKQVTGGFWTGTLMKEWWRAKQGPWQRLSRRCIVDLLCATGATSCCSRGCRKRVQVAWDRSFVLLICDTDRPGQQKRSKSARL